MYFNYVRRKLLKIIGASFVSIILFPFKFANSEIINIINKIGDCKIKAFKTIIKKLS